MSTTSLTGAAPDYKAAWAYYEKNVLPRTKPKYDKPGEPQNGWQKLEPGEEHEDSRLYNVWGDPVNEIGDFGIGIILYFKMLLILTGTMIVCLLLNAPALNYFKSNEYSDGHPTGVDGNLKMGGSAICDRLLPICTIPLIEGEGGCECKVYLFSDTVSTWNDMEWPAYKNDDTYTIEGDGCAWYNSCEMDFVLARYDGAMTIFLLLGILVLGKLQDKTIDEADADNQTAQDYSIIVNDPDADATDPAEWQAFFSQFGHVSYVTVAINNGPLMHKLAARRVLLQKITFETALPADKAHMYDPVANEKDFEGLSGTKKKLIGVGLSSDISVLRKQLFELDGQITALLNGPAEGKQYEAVKVFVTFDTEAGQRACLKEMCIGLVPALLNTATLPDGQKFRGVNVLSISEAPEPSDVIFVNLETSMKHQIIEQSLTFLATCAAVGISGVLIWSISNVSPAGGGLFISLANGLLPAFLKALNESEEHLTQASRQSSLLVKLVLCRWMTTGFIVWAIRGYEQTLNENFLKKVAAVLFADAFTTPILRFLDIGGRLGRNWSARSAKTQEKMNDFFKNTSWFLAERYTDMTKTLFVGLFFSTLFPGGLIFSFLSFFVCYWVDKYCLFRLWRQPPVMDASLTVSSRLQIAVIVIIHSVLAGQFYAGFPFSKNYLAGCTADDDCDVQVTSMTLITVDTDGIDNSATATAVPSPLFSEIPSDELAPQGIFIVPTNDYMSDEQKTSVYLFSALNVILMVVVSVMFFGKGAAFSVYKLFKGDYIERGEPSDIAFHYADGIDAYTPQHDCDTFIFPLIAADLSKMDVDHLSFTTKDYNVWNMTKDAIVLEAQSKGIDTSKAFSKIQQWKSPAKQKDEAKAGAGNRV